MKLCAPLSIIEAAQLLGWTTDHKAKRLRRYLLAADARCGRRLLVRSAGPTRPSYTVTVASLRRFCPELFDRATELSIVVRRELTQLREDMREGDDALRARVVYLEERNRSLSKEVARLRTAQGTAVDTRGRLAA
jgi:hypothetical protein